MSKYYKAEDIFQAIDKIIQNATETDAETIMDTGLVIEINKLPTIEVSEDCVSRKWLEENAKEFGDYYENTVWAVPLSVLTDAPSVVPKERINNGQF